MSKAYILIHGLAGSGKEVKHIKYYDGGSHHIFNSEIHTTVSEDIYKFIIYGGAFNVNGR